MKNWEKDKLQNIATRITKGSTPTTYGYKYLEKGIPFVKVENLANGRIDKSSITQFISEDAHEFQKRSQLIEGDILFSIAGTIGRVAMVRKDDVPANTNQAIAIIRGTGEVETLVYDTSAAYTIGATLYSNAGILTPPDPGAGVGVATVVRPPTYKNPKLRIRISLEGVTNEME